ncbi:MAG: nitrite/sulfite reductase [Lachnospiraceae bacterium]|nr:nitrite/sulfite reductase [Lachnospiraceae bacterium]
MVGQEDLKQFREDLKEFHRVTGQFYRGEITVPQYKSFSGGFGSYAQRGGKRSMLRLRLPAGEIGKEKLLFIKDSIEKYNIDMVHLTTCQTVQLHNLTEQQVCSLVEEAFDHGIITRGGGGDFPRNVMCSPLSGVQNGEAFDVQPFAKAAGDYLLSLINRVKLPRKLKVCFSNGVGNEVHATFRDMGFVAKENQTFDVYIAGGLGVRPKFGVLVAEDVKPEEVLYHIRSMVDVFTKYGNYEKRSESRSRFLQDKLTPEGLREAYQKQLEINLQADGLMLDIHELRSEYVDRDIENKQQRYMHSGAPDTFSDSRILSLKQPGLYAVSYHPVGGSVEPGFFGRLYEELVLMEGGVVRLTPDQGMYIINLSEEEAKRILELTKADKGTLFERSTACIGADICQVGIGKSQALLKACVERIKEEDFADGVLPAIHISGCPSSCGTHQTAILGFRGGKKQTSEGLRDAFAVYENGTERIADERFGNELGVMLEEDIPDFLVELGRAVAEKNMLFDEFHEKYHEDFLGIIQKYV